MGCVVGSKSLIDGPSQHSTNFMAESFNLGKRRIPWRPVWSVSHCSQCGYTLVKLFLRLVTQYDYVLSVLAHASFSSRYAKTPRLREYRNKLAQIPEPRTRN